jgi:hypothetical protein
MRIRTPVYPEHTQVQPGDTDDLTMVNLSSPPAGTLLVPEGTMSTALAPGQVMLVPRVFTVRKLLRIRPYTNIDSAGELLSRGCQRRKGCDIRFR